MKYRLRLHVDIQQCDDSGYSSGNYSDNLQVTEDINFEATSFLEVAHVLGQFHETAQKIKAID